MGQHRGVVVAGCAAAAMAAGASAQSWMAVNLHPAGAISSSITASANGGFGGTVDVPNGAFRLFRPAFWPGLSSSWVDLLGSYPGPGGAFVNAMWGDQQGGLFRGGALWSGTPESRVDLEDPPHASVVLGMGPGQQVGYRDEVINGTSRDHAVLWRGTPESRVDLNPPGYYSSYAYDTDGAYQGGWALEIENQSPRVAALWNGTAESFVNLNPPWARGSEIWGMAPGQQVGFSNLINEAGNHATIWSSTAASAIDVHPFPGFGGSYLYATNGRVQVGTSNVPGFSLQHAGAWFGTAESFVDLHQFLPPEYQMSGAATVHEHNGVVYVGGWAALTPSVTHAVVWVMVPAPGAGAVLLAAGVLAMRRRR